MLSFLLLGSSFIPVIWSFVFIVSSIFKTKLYKISGNKMTSFFKLVKYASIWNDNDPDGWICGKWYIGYITLETKNGDSGKELYILCTTKFYKEIIDKEIVSESGKPQKFINFIEREGAIWRSTYTSRQIQLNISPRAGQQKIVSQIVADFEKNEYSVVLLHGPIGKGKSIISILTCLELLRKKKGVTLCDTFNPTDPNDTFAGLYAKINPENDNPLVVVIEEIDTIINKIHNDNVPKHNDYYTQLKNKTDWNTFMDRFDRKMYSNIILILTTNQSAEYFDKLDPSYMRHGRTTLKINVK